MHVDESGSIAFTRHLSEVPTIYAIGVLAAIELVVVHLLVSRWSESAALLLLLVSILGIASIAATVRRLIKNPVLLTPTGLTVTHRDGSVFRIPFSSIADFEDTTSSPAPRGQSVLQFSLFAHPNVSLRLAEPIEDRRGRKFSRLSFRVDKPRQFFCELRAREGEERSARPGRVSKG
jgi:hypothetical protein